MASDLTSIQEVDEMIEFLKGIHRDAELHRAGCEKWQHMSLNYVCGSCLFGSEHTVIKPMLSALALMKGRLLNRSEKSSKLEERCIYCGFVGKQASLRTNYKCPNKECSHDAPLGKQRTLGDIIEGDDKHGKLSTNDN
jgi:hypothetical protein